MAETFDRDKLVVPVEVSARHIHLSQEDQDLLFGEGHEMTIKKELSQTGQWAAEERVTVKGPKGELKCTVLGPCRKQTQVEFSFSDGFATGIEVQLRESGDLAGTSGCTVIGPKGEIELAEGVINPQRHLHIGDAEAAERGIAHHDVISFYLENGNSSLTYHNAVVRVDPTFRMNVHLDTDEGNACSLGRAPVTARIVKIERDGETVYHDTSV